MGIDFQFTEELRFWHWFILGVVLLGLEIVLPGTFFLWMGVAAGIVGLLVLVLPPFGWEIQVLVFAALSILAVVGGRIWLRRHPTQTAEPNLNVRGAQYLGRVLHLSEPMVDGIGKVRLGDTLWRVATGDDTDLSEGTRVRVVGVDGATLKVEPADPAGNAASGPV